jgi:hypothetical protein
MQFYVPDHVVPLHTQHRRLIECRRPNRRRLGSGGWLPKEWFTGNRTTAPPGTNESFRQ